MNKRMRLILLVVIFVLFVAPVGLPLGNTVISKYSTVSAGTDDQKGRTSDGQILVLVCIPYLGCYWIWIDVV